MLEWPIVIEVIVAILLGIAVLYLLKILFSRWEGPRGIG